MTHILTKEQFQKFQARFKQRANAKLLTPDDMLLYAMVKGKGWELCFTPIKNPTKLKCQCNDDSLMNIKTYWHRLRRSAQSHAAQKWQTGTLVEYPGIFDLVAYNSLYLAFATEPKLEEKNNG